MKIVATSKADQNDSAIDPWTVVHFGVGLAAGLMGFGFAPSMLAATAYEVFEQGLERSGFGQDLFLTSGPENMPNVVVDLAVFGVGHWLGARWNDT
jgi:hypothetical protein